MLIRASEVSSADLGSYAKDLAQNLLGQTRFETFCRFQDINLSKSFLYFTQGSCIALALLAQRDQRMHLSALAVHPLYRSRGLGKELLSAVIGESTCSSLTLDVLARNGRALSFFSAQGFYVIRTHGFWYRILPLQWRSDGPKPREISACIALELTEPGMAWAAESVALSKKITSLRGLVCFDNGQVSGSAVYSVRLNSIVIYRLVANHPDVLKSMLRHMHLSAPAASTVYLRFMTEGILSEHLVSIGLRRHSQYHTLSMQKAGVSQA